MRRLVSALSLKRSKTSQNGDKDRSDASFISSTTSHSTKRASTIPPTIPTFPRTSTSDQFGALPSLTTSVSSNPSSASSAGSRLLTPVDEVATVPVQLPSRKKVFTWFSSKRGSRSAPRLSASESPPTAIPPSSRSSQAIKITPQSRDSDTSDSEQENDDDDDEEGFYTPSHPQASSPELIARAKSRLHAITTNGLIQQPSSSPFYHAPTALSFPRSCHSTKSLPAQQTQQMRMHKARLKTLLDASDSFDGLDPRSLSSFSRRSIPSLIKEPASFDADEPMPERKRVTAHSPGYDRWVARGTFEALHVEWVPNSDGIVTYHVITCSNAVADLEFSSHLETIAMLGEDDHQTMPFLPTPPTPSPPAKGTLHTSNGSSLHVSASENPVPRPTPYTAVPSPLRVGHAPPSVVPSSPKQPAVQLGASDSPAVPLPKMPGPAVKRGVRFAEDDKDEILPLGYVIRMKQRKAEKAKFLKEEAEKRQFQVERARVEAERRQREEERRQWERERVAWEKEKQKAEEERKARLYAEELALARQRRESFRAGRALHKDSAGLPLPAAKDSATMRSTRSESNRHSRPTYDNTFFPQNGPHSRKVVSDSSSGPTISTSGMPVSADGNSSPASSGSRPSSLTGFPHSRPPSVHTTPMTSVEDVRASTSSSGRRKSAITSHSQQPSLESLGAIPYSNSWTGGVMPMIPAMPQVPFYMNVAMDPNTMAMMPLLPPTPPFMVQQYPMRSKSRHSSPSSQRNNQSSTSLDRVHLAASSSRRASSNGSMTSLQVPSRGGSVSSSPSRSHQRHSSGEPQPGPSTERGRRSQGRPSGRSHVPSASQTYLPSPWTGVPSSGDIGLHYPQNQRKTKSKYLS